MKVFSTSSITTKPLTTKANPALLSRVLLSINKGKIIRFFLQVIIFGVAIFIILNAAVINFYSEKIYKDKIELPATQYGIVFGSAVNEDGETTDVLRDRVMTAVDLYKAGKIQNILISGESRYANYSETKIMRDILTENKVPDFVILEDGNSGRTFDTCIRAKKIFNINKAILITQEFHLPRALYLCSSMGIESDGFAADVKIYEQTRLYQIREYFALINAMLDLYYVKPYDYNSLSK